MQFIELKNPRVLDILEKFRYLYREKYDVTKTNSNQISNMIDDMEEYTSEEYLRKVIASGESHLGFPARAYLWPIKPEHYKGDDPQYRVDFEKVNSELMTELGLFKSALTAFYPPKGFIDWHNNANASSFNIVFTWSETGDGWFKWYDIENDKIVTMKDKKGWSAKCGYFASYGEENPLKYHCAYTNCFRMTLGFMLGKDEDYWEDMVDYIQCED